VGNGQGANNSLIRALAHDLLPGTAFDPLDAAWEQPWTGPRPQLLEAVDGQAWRHAGDTRERLELLALQWLEQPGLSSADLDAGWEDLAVLQRVQHDLRPLAGLWPAGDFAAVPGTGRPFCAAGPSGRLRAAA
jgi:cobaltochelatase CobN